MSLETISGNDLARCVKAGCIRLERNKETVDLLNVFPVPDGDTGTNMYLTLLSAVKEGERNSQQPLGKVAKAISMGSLMGARGNSGVILSQVFRGIAKVLEGKEEANALELAQALRAGSDTAYKAVMKPVEGTILTVLRELSRVCEIEAKKGKDIVSTLLAGLEEGRRTLAKTPAMLPVLREAGVVDSGGQGLIFFLEGVLEGLAREKDIPLDIFPEQGVIEREIRPKEIIETEFQYCTEVLIKGEALEVENIKKYLLPLGDSLLAVGYEDIVKIHIHSNHPGQVLETCLSFGSLSDIKINNMVEEIHEHLNVWAEGQSKPLKEIGLVAVGAGEGIIKILKSLGADEVVEGGQTMNPSTEELLKACNQVEARVIIILPNNSNVIMAAQQVQHLSEKRIEVVPTRSVMQAISALIAYDAGGEADKVIAAMNEEMHKVAYGEVTCAVRDSTMNGLDIKEGDIIGMTDGDIRVKGSGFNEVVLNLLAQMIDEESELITFLYGEDTQEGEAEELKDQISSLYPECEVEMHYGGQKYYNYFLSVE